MMTGVLFVALVVLVAWLGTITYVVLVQRRELQLMLLALKHVAGAEKHVGGTGRNHRRTDFRVPVNLSGFLHVLDHARPCRIVDMSRSGAQVRPDGGEFPVGERGMLTIDFGEFESVSTPIKVVRAIDATGTYGIEFIDPPSQFVEKATHTIRSRFRAQLGRD